MLCSYIAKLIGFSRGEMKQESVQNQASRLGLGASKYMEVDAIQEQMGWRDLQKQN